MRPPQISDTKRYLRPFAGSSRPRTGPAPWAAPVNQHQLLLAVRGWPHATPPTITQLADPLDTLDEDHPPAP